MPIHQEPWEHHLECVELLQLLDQTKRLPCHPQLEQIYHLSQLSSVLLPFGYLQGERSYSLTALASLLEEVEGVVGHHHLVEAVEAEVVEASLKYLNRQRIRR